MFKFSVVISIVILGLFAMAWGFTPSGLLEVHYINVQTAGCAMVIGPNGTSILMDGGENGDGTSNIIPYLQSIGFISSDALSYVIGCHLDSDHIGGLDEVINAFDVSQRVYYNGSTKSNTYVTAFMNAAIGTTAGPAQPMPLGTIIQLGDGATATCVAVHGNILGGGTVSVSEENDMSVVMLVKYGKFAYIYSSDLGGGDDDQACTGRHTATNYANVETPLVQSLRSPTGANLLGTLGVEVAHIGHHGSEGSGNHDWANYLTPRIACVNVGADQTDGWDFPRIDVIDNVFLSGATACVTAPPSIVLQTEEGVGSPGTSRSYNGYCVGDIVIKTNGQRLFLVSGSGRLHGGPDERSSIGLPRYFPMDEDTTDHILPGTVADLRTVGGPGSNQIRLLWTAPGDDGSTGQNAMYDIRYCPEASGAINSTARWNAAIQLTNEKNPKTGGLAETLVVSGLTYGSGYYFALKATDKNLNVSALSNSPRGTAGPSPCSYVLGDINGDGLLIGGDATYGVRYFKAIGPQPPDSCQDASLPGNGYLYVAGDVNGNCEFRGSDITRLISYFKGLSPLEYCNLFPPPALRNHKLLKKD
jgi:beta-lactamase superfamily II metal-dependent hydrolase